MFIDRVTIHVASGAGGDGAVAFRREKFVPLGGPAGGDGGHGGAVFLEADPQRNTLMDFRYRRHFRAQAGARGRAKNQFGKSALDLVIPVPVGTVVLDATSQEGLADLNAPGLRVLLAKGGKGGRGNARFATPTARAPHYAEPGQPGAARDLVLELRLLADVGLVGLPNAGKSSLLAAISAATPKIADYPFTTIEPNLGVVRWPDGDGFVVADIPGLIAGASQGAGLGHEFLRHVERTRLLLHLVDVAEPDPIGACTTIARELAAYSETLGQRPRLIVPNKIDLLAERALLAAWRARWEEAGFQVFPLSSATREGIDALLNAVRALLPTLPLPALALPEAHPPSAEEPPPAPFRIHTPGAGRFVIESERLERLIALSDLSHLGALDRLHRILERWGVMLALRERGIAHGDEVRVGDFGFEWLD
jgi:GTP-binding protein